MAQKMQAGLDLNLGDSEGMLDKLGAKLRNALTPPDLPASPFKLSGQSTAAIEGMKASLTEANAAADRNAVIMARLQAALYGVAATARVASAAINLMPKVFADLHPGVLKTLSGVSLASRGFDILRGRLGPLGSAMAYLELKNLGVRKSYAALTASLGFGVSSVVKATKTIGSASAKLGGGLFAGLGGAATSLMGPLLALGSTAAAFAGLKNVFDIAGGLNDTSGQTGILVDELQVLEQAFTNTKLGAEKVGPSVNKLQKALQGLNDDGDPTDSMFARLRLNMDELQKKTPVQQMQEVGDAINKLKSPTERSAAAIAIFGKSGAEMLALFNDPGALSAAATQLGSQSAILKKDAALFDSISDNLAAAGLKVQGFFVGVADQVAPIIQPLLDAFTATDWASVGQQFGGAIAYGVTALTDGTIWGILGESIKIALGTGINFLWAGLMGVFGAIGKVFPQLMANSLTVFEILTTADFWKGMGNALMGIAKSFEAYLIDAIAKVIETLHGTPLIGQYFRDGSEIRAKAQAVRDSAAGSMGDAGFLLAPAVDKVQGRIGATLLAAADGFSQSVEKAGSLIDLSGAEASLNEKMDAIGKKVLDQQNAAYATPGKKPGAAMDALVPKQTAQSFRDVAIGGFGVFSKNILAKDPMLSEAQRQTREQEKTNSLLEQLIKTTGIKLQPSPLRFTAG